MIDLTLQCLALPPAELEQVREEVRRRAYFKWLHAGCPEGESLRFWREAELEWIEFEHLAHLPYFEAGDEYPIECVRELAPTPGTALQLQPSA